MREHSSAVERCTEDRLVAISPAMLRSSNAQLDVSSAAAEHAAASASRDSALARNPPANLQVMQRCIA